MSGDDLDAVGFLQDPVRRELYRFVTAQGRDIGRGEAAEATGVQRTLAAFHLDKLVEAGLLESGFKRLGERTGPGSGRPAKVYRRAHGERTVSLPPRDYRTLALVLAEVVDALGGDERAEAVARRVGERLARDLLVREGRNGAGPAEQWAGGSTVLDEAAPAEPSSVLLRVLEERGYEPYLEGDRVRMRNCPFHVLAEEHPVLICSMNLALCQGLLRGLGEEGDAARLDPRSGECCVSFSNGGVSKNNED